MPPPGLGCGGGERKRVGIMERVGANIFHPTLHEDIICSFFAQFSSMPKSLLRPRNLPNLASHVA